MKTARVLFDEFHSEAWTIRPTAAQAMQPAHPADASYAKAAGSLGEESFVVQANTDAPLSAALLAEWDVLVIAHPSAPEWERTTGLGSPALDPQEIEAIVQFVAGGGGLIVLGETEQDKYGNNLNELLEHFGIHLENETVQDYEHSLHAPSWILAELVDGERGRGGDLLARVHAACLYRATTISSRNGARVLARSYGTASNPGAPLIVATEHGHGRVVVLADSDLFGDDCLDELDHRTLWLNLCQWTARREVQPGQASTFGEERAWIELRDETNALALLQAPDGSLSGPPEQAATHVDRIASALRALAPSFPHQSDYLAAATQDLREWAGAGFEKPDFRRSLDLFRPEQERRDGATHLAFFPMYKQNGSRDTCFEALVIRVPWPEHVARLERSRYQNPKFVPVELLAGTRGYDSECAVLFPEMVSVAERAPNNFGAIFCDREAERLRRVAGAAVDLLAVNLPPDAARMLASEEETQAAYILWDLIHDRAHSHGELPFDPFMIRQRSPYWMYSLEELRCDLTAFTQAVELERDGHPEVPGIRPHARRVQYAILLDRLLRFPITGSRVRNYDGLGGQLLFAYLHRAGHLVWEDNQLTIDWETVGAGVASLRREVEDLYRAGIDRTKLQHWSAAHDLISQSVPPAAGSRWAVGVRDFQETPDPRPYVDLVLEDEFPLSIFYETLRGKLGAASAR